MHSGPEAERLLKEWEPRMRAARLAYKVPPPAPPFPPPPSLKDWEARMRVANRAFKVSQPAPSWSRNTACVWPSSVRLGPDLAPCPAKTGAPSMRLNRVSASVRRLEGPMPSQGRSMPSEDRGPPP